MTLAVPELLQLHDNELSQHLSQAANEELVRVMPSVQIALSDPLYADDEYIMDRLISIYNIAETELLRRLNT